MKVVRTEKVMAGDELPCDPSQILHKDLHNEHVLKIWYLENKNE